MTPTFFITLMLSFGALCAVGLWLFDGYKQDKEKQERLNQILYRKDIKCLSFHQCVLPKEL